MINTPATFQLVMDSVLRGKTCVCYLDDIVAFSSTFSENYSVWMQYSRAPPTLGFSSTKKKVSLEKRSRYWATL